MLVGSVNPFQGGICEFGGRVKSEIDSVAICTSGEMFGGVEQFVYSYVSYLNEEKDRRVIVVTLSDGVLYRKLKERGVETYVVEVGKCELLVGVRRVASILKENGIGIVHTNGYRANILCGIAGRICGLKVVKTEHGLVEPSGFYDRSKMKAYLGVDRFVSKMVVRGVAFVSRDLARRQCFYNKGVRTVVINNGIDSRRVETNQEPVELDEKCFNVGMVGRLSLVKGHRYLLEALLHLSDIPMIKVIFIGSGELDEELKRFSVTHGLEARVKFLGFREDVNSYLRRFDLLVMPSLHEGLPYTLLEAMQGGVPVIASKVGGMLEVLTHERDALLVEPRNSAEIADAIRRLYNDRKLMDKLRRNATEKVRRDLSIEAMCRKYDKLYLNV